MKGAVPEGSRFKVHEPFLAQDLVKRLHANKAQLLMVLDRPETPLHTNGSEKRYPPLCHKA